MTVPPGIDRLDVSAPWRFPLLLDDAAIFPPGNASLQDAIAAHQAHRTAPYAPLVGPLVVGLKDLDDLAGVGSLDVAVVVDDAAAAVAAIRRATTLHGVRLVALEVSDTGVAEVRDALHALDGESLDAASGGAGDVTVYVELPRDDRRMPLIRSLAGTPYRAKLRTGGTRSELYPDEAELAAALVALAAAQVPFKATAGLHHALRNTDPETGFEQHGFLNLLAATERASRGEQVADVAAVLAERDFHRVPIPVGSPHGAWLLSSIGTCDVSEPVAELIDLGLLTLTGQAATP